MPRHPTRPIVFASGVLLFTAVLAAGAADPEDAEPPPYKPARSDYGTVNAAWDYADKPPSALPAGMKLVAADLSLPPAPEEGFDLDDIDIFDGDSGKHLGGGPYVQRLTQDGEPVDEGDPVVRDEERYRGIFIWGVPASVKRVNFGYRGNMLYRKAVALQPRGPVVPRSELSVQALESPAKTGKGDRRYTAIVRALNWSRVRGLDNYVLRASAASKSRNLCDCDRWIELAADNTPLQVRLTARPYFEKERRFVIEFWCPADTTPDVIDRFGEKAPLPKVSALGLPRKTLDALADAAACETQPRRKEPPPRR